MLSRMAEAANAQVSVPGDDPLRLVIEPLDANGGVTDAQVEAVQSILESNARDAWKRVQDREREREMARQRAAMDADKARMAQETAQRAVRAAEDRPPEEIRKGGGKGGGKGGEDPRRSDQRGRDDRRDDRGYGRSDYDSRGGRGGPYERSD